MIANEAEKRILLEPLELDEDDLKKLEDFRHASLVLFAQSTRDDNNQSTKDDTSLLSGGESEMIT